MTGIQYPFCVVLAIHVTVVMVLQRIFYMNDKKVALIVTHSQAGNIQEKEHED